MRNSITEGAKSGLHVGKSFSASLLVLSLFLYAGKKLHGPSRTGSAVLNFGFDLAAYLAPVFLTFGALFALPVSAALGAVFGCGKHLLTQSNSRCLSGSMGGNFNANFNGLSIFVNNVNSDRRVDDPTKPFAAAFADLSFESRFALNAALYEDALTRDCETFFMLQEANDLARDMLVGFFNQKKLKTLTEKYTLDSGAFNFVFAYNPEIYHVLGISQLYFTKSGLPTNDEDRKTLSKDEKLERHLGTEFEKSAQLVRLFHKKSGEVFLIVNMHPSVEMGIDPKTKEYSPEKDHRLLAMQKLCDALKNEHGQIILAGDFNQFDARVAEPKLHDAQIKILQENKFLWVSEGLSHLGMKGTFISFPFDVLRYFSNDEKDELKLLEERKADAGEIRLFFIRKIREKSISLYGASLDGVYVRGLPKNTNVQVNAYTLFNRERIDTTQMKNPEEIQEKFLKHFEENKASDGVAPPLPSDHVVLRVKIIPISGM